MDLLAGFVDLILHLDQHLRELAHNYGASTALNGNMRIFVTELLRHHCEFARYIAP